MTQTRALMLSPGIRLEKRRPKRNSYRFYILAVEPNLFGEWSLVQEWGRIGQSRRTRIECHATWRDAQAAMLRAMRQKQRKGYA